LAPLACPKSGTPNGFLLFSSPFHAAVPSLYFWGYVSFSV
jgi:hypothetical protein